MHVVAMLTCIATTGELAAQQKTPVPDEAAEQAAKKTAGEIYGGRFALAKTAADKSALAAEMIGAALKIQNGSADQFVVLKVARDIAVGAGDATTALSAVKELVQRFDVPALTLPAETLLAAAEQATMTAQRKGVAEAAGPIITKLAEANEYDLAIRVCEAARVAAQGAREFKLAGELSNQLPELKRLEQESQAYRDARAVMEANPTEPAANLAAGRYLCFVKGDWERGVPMLALGSDSALKSVALMDLRGAESAEAQAAIGDAWWDLAETKHGEERDTLRLRAAFWYRQAVPKLAGGLVGLKVKQRLEEISKLGGEVPAASSRPATSRTPPLAIAPFDEQTAKQHQSAWAKHLGVPVLYTNSISMRFVLIPPGEFMMGSTGEEAGKFLEEAKRRGDPKWMLERTRSEVPKRRVKITRPFYVGMLEVTQLEYERVMGLNPSRFKGKPTHPVEQVSWQDAQDFCRRLSETPDENSRGAAYRLPTEAEWEYVCRAGTTMRFSFGDDPSIVQNYAWWGKNSGPNIRQRSTQIVGQLRPNAFGLFDLHGNVWEWCADWYASDLGLIPSPEDPAGPASGSTRVSRGGSYLNAGPDALRCAFRFDVPPDTRSVDIGFRVARTLGP